MSSLTDINKLHTYASSSGAQDKVPGATLDTELAAIYAYLDSIRVVFDQVLRDDDAVKDDLIEYRMLHPSLKALLPVLETFGSSLVEAATAADARTLLDVLSSAQLAAAYQPLDADLTALAALTTTAFGRSFLELADAPAARTLIGLDTVSQAEAEAGVATTPRAWTAERVAQLVATKAAVLSVFGRAGAVVAAASDYDASQIDDDSSLGLGTVAAALDFLAQDLQFKQPLDATLTSIANLSPAADQAIYFTALDTAAAFAITTVGRTLVGQATKAAARSYLEFVDPILNKLAPGAIGTDTPDAGRFTTIRAGGDVTLDDGVNIVTNGTTGSKIGSTATDKLALWGQTPAVQPAGIADAETNHLVTGGNTVDLTGLQNALDALGGKVNAIIAALETSGNIATV